MMKRSLILVCLTLTASLTVLASDSPEDSKLLLGKWVPVSAQLDGQPLAEAVLKTISLKLDHGKYEVLVSEHPDRGTYTIEATTTPKSITVFGMEGPNQGKTFPAIYELKDDTLRICYDLSGVKRPVEFKSIAGTKLYLVTYQRKKE